jgi:hypothetical protein
MSLIQILISVISATAAAVIASNKVVKDNEHRFTTLEAQAIQNKTNIAEQSIKIDQILSAVQTMQLNCVAMHSGARMENRQ